MLQSPESSTSGAFEFRGIHLSKIEVRVLVPFSHSLVTGSLVTGSLVTGSLVCSWHVTQKKIDLRSKAVFKLKGSCHM